MPDIVCHLCRSFMNKMSEVFDKLKWFISTLLLLPTHLLLTQEMVAQPPQIIFEHYTIEDGLSMNSISAILQDHKGLMWFGTYGEGLNCWDGYRFTVYKHNSQDPYSLRSNRINGIWEDSENNFWIRTWEGLDLFDRKHNQFIHDKKFIHQILGIKQELDINDIFEDSHNNIWITTTDRELKLLNKNDSSITSFFRYPDKTDSAIYSLTVKMVRFININLEIWQEKSYLMNCI